MKLMRLRRAWAQAEHLLERVQFSLWRLRPRRRLSILERNLILLHDALAESNLGGRYWIFGGALLGWAREGRLLRHDTDIDLALSRGDIAYLRGAVPLLKRAGFRLSRAYVNNRGEITEYVFVRNWLKFEFFVVDPSQAGLDYWVYSPPDRIEMLGRMPTVTLSPMRLLGRTWLKPTDHEAFLDHVYGDWRIPRPDYCYVRDDKSIISRRAWTGFLLWAPLPEEIR